MPTYVGAPNITGKITGIRRIDTWPDSNPGAIYWTDKYDGRTQVNQESNISSDPSFKASRSNDVYSGNKLQPRALMLLVCIRY